MLLVGDKIKQVKAIPGFNFVGQVFVVEGIRVEGVDDVTIVFSVPSLGRGLMTKADFEEYFVKVIEPKWSDWEDYGFDLEYRLKGELLEVRAKGTDTSVFAKPCEDDEFDLDIGMSVCIQKLKIRELKSFIKDITRKTNIIIAKAQQDIAEINRIIETRF